MTLTEEQRAALKRVVAYMDEMYAIASPYHGCTEDANILRAMIDSSEQFNDATKLIGFDLERARGLRDFLQDDCAEVGDVWAEMIAEIERLREALDESERVVAHKTKSAAHWYDEHLQARADRVQTRRVVEQQAARIKALETWLKKERSARLLEQSTSIRLVYLVENEIDFDDFFDGGALEQLQAEGKIGPDADAKPHCWQITEERKAALWHAINVLKENDIMEEPEEHLWDEEVTVLQAMLTEAE